MCTTYSYGFCLLATPGLDVWSHSGQIEPVCQGCFPSCMDSQLLQQNTYGIKQKFESSDAALHILSCLTILGTYVFTRISAPTISPNSTDSSTTHCR